MEDGGWSLKNKRFWGFGGLMVQENDVRFRLKRLQVGV